MGTSQFKNTGLTKIEGYKTEYLKDGIFKFENDSALIYIKPTPFYAPEHNPMVCWSGSGYTFKYIKKEFVNGNEIYTGMLIKGRDKIYTAWWFDNGIIKTVDQIKWRWNSAKNNQPFFLVNLNTYSHEHLYKLLKTQKIL